MIPAPCATMAPVPPPAYHRAQAKVGPALHVDALSLVSGLHLLTLCRLAVRLARRSCPPMLAAGPGGPPRPSSGGGPLRVAAPPPTSGGRASLRSHPSA